MGKRMAQTLDGESRREMLGEVAAEHAIPLKKRVWSPKAGRKIIPLETVVALRRRNLSYPQIAKILGCSESNVRYRLGTVADEIERVDDFKKHKADIMAIHQNRILQSVTETNLKDAKLRDKAIAFGILFDKERLERGKSTQNVAYADLLKMKNEKLKELEELDGATVVG